MMGPEDAADSVRKYTWAGPVEITPLIFGDFDGSRSKRLLLEHPEHHPHCNDYENVAQQRKPPWHFGPSKTAVQPGDDERGDAPASPALTKIIFWIVRFSGVGSRLVLSSRSTGSHEKKCARRTLDTALIPR